MLNQRLQAAKGVADELFPAEEMLENAILHTSRIMIAVIEGRRTARLPVTAGQTGLERALKAASHLAAARAELGAAHAAFHQTQIEIGLREVSFGWNSECPTEGAASDSARNGRSLSVVAGSQAA